MDYLTMDNLPPYKDHIKSHIKNSESVRAPLVATSPLMTIN